MVNGCHDKARPLFGIFNGFHGNLTPTTRQWMKCSHGNLKPVGSEYNGSHGNLKPVGSECNGSHGNLRPLGIEFYGSSCQWFQWQC